MKISVNKLQQLPKLLLLVYLSLLFCDLFVLIYAYLTGDTLIHGIRQILNFDSEQNIPTFFIVVMLLCCSFLLYLLYTSEKTTPVKRKYWFMLSLIFLLGSLDEFVSFHERLIGVMRRLFGITDGLFYFAWVIPGIILVLVFVMFFLKFYLGLPNRFKLLFGVSAAIYCSGAIGMEMIDGFFFTESGTQTLLYNLLTTIEESLEMTAIILFIYSLIKYIKTEIQATEYSLSE
jgi:hypothetical protein